MPTLTPEQSGVLEAILADLQRRRVVSLGGYAGTGKSTVLVELRRRLPEFGVACLTGKAASVLRRKGVGDASTIHSLIYRARKRPGGGVEFVLKDERPAPGLLIDEASMVGGPLFDDLMSYGIPLVLVGDHGQLPPIGPGPNLMTDPDHRLETLHRNAGPIAKFAEHLRKGGSARRFEARGRVRLVARRDVDGAKLVGVGQVIVGFNKTRIRANRAAREYVGRTGGRPRATGSSA